MERLTKRNECGDAYYPECYERCYGEGSSEKCNDCDYDEKICDTLADYEDTGLTSEQIRELKERDTAKAPEIHKNKFSDAYTCPNCNLLVIYKDETGWFCGKHYSFCPDCGQKLKWED